MIFAPDCDADAAAEIARRILAKLSKQAESLDCARFSVSIGIAVQASAADFDRMYHDADTALYHAKAEGKSRIALFEPFMTSFRRRAA
jgi:PleD family two-component response regulator